MNCVEEIPSKINFIPKEKLAVELSVGLLVLGTDVGVAVDGDAVGRKVGACVGTGVGPRVGRLDVGIAEG